MTELAQTSRGSVRANLIARTAVGRVNAFSGRHITIRTFARRRYGGSLTRVLFRIQDDSAAVSVVAAFLALAGATELAARAHDRAIAASIVDARIRGTSIVVVAIGIRRAADTALGLVARITGRAI